MGGNNMDNPKEMKIVGKRSNGKIALYLVLGFVFVLVGVASIVFVVLASSSDAADEGFAVLAGIVFAMLGIGFLVVGIITLRLPKNLIAVSGTDLILLRENIVIKFSDIVSIIPRIARGRGLLYLFVAFGTIIIKTKYGEEFEQGSVAEVEDVADMLNKKIRKY